jgi:hypothetical protein
VNGEFNGTDPELCSVAGFVISGVKFCSELVCRILLLDESQAKIGLK